MKNYFPHDHHARADKKIVALTRKMGMQGYGLYWCLVEMLYEEGGWLNLKDIEDIAYDVRVDTSVIESLVRDFDLFFVEGERFSSNAVLARLKVIEEKSSKAARSARARWSQSEQNAPAQQSQSEPLASAEQTQSEGNANAYTNDANASQEDANAYDLGCEGNAIKENKRKENKTVIVVDVDARENENFQPQQPAAAAPKETPPNPPLLTPDEVYFSYRDEIKKQQSFRESCILGMKIPAESLDEWIDEFTLMVRARGQKYDGLKDFRDHCTNTLRIKATNQGSTQPRTPKLNFNGNNGGPRAKANSGPYGQGADLTGIVYEQQSW